MTIKSESLSLEGVYTPFMAFGALQLQHQVTLQLNIGFSVSYAGHGGSSRGRNHSPGGVLVIFTLSNHLMSPLSNKP
jgi:hypothetical protein